MVPRGRPRVRAAAAAPYRAGRLIPSCTLRLAPSQLVRRDAVDLVERIGAIPGLETLAMTTNALTLSRKIPRLVEAGLTHVNISLDTLLDFKFEIITRRRGFAKVMQGIEDSIAAGLRVKINCTFVRTVADA